MHMMRKGQVRDRHGKTPLAAYFTRGRFALAEGFPSSDGSLLTDGASLAAAKHTFDPDGILTPGQGIF